MKVVDFTANDIGARQDHRYNKHEYIIDFTGNVTTLVGSGIAEIDEEKSSIFLFFSLCDEWKDKGITLYQTMDSVYLGTNNPDTVVLIKLAVT